MKNSLYTLFLLLTAFAASAQVNVSLTLRPPYSAAIKDYYHLENKAIIVLTNTSRVPVEVKLGGSISNESRGVYIRTEPAYRPAMPIRLAGGATVTLTANAEAMNFFDQGNVTTNANDAMVANIIRTGMLPEGNYRICINAYDYNTGRQLSNNDVGCFNFDISQAGPPMITFPQPDYVYPAEQVAKNFSWTPPMGNIAGTIIEYDQIVVKLQPGQNPNDAIAAARDFGAGNPVINRRGQLGQTYITQPMDLQFETGATYAIQVVARDRNQRLLLENDGRSEIVTFGIGNIEANTGLNLQRVDDVAIPEFYLAKTVTGTLKYYWPITAGNNTGNGMQVQGTGVAGMVNSPLKGVRVKLVLAWQIVDEENDRGVGFLLPGGLVPPLSKVSRYEGNHAQYRNDYAAKTLATATTNADGGFSFNVVNADNIDFSIQYGAIDIDGLGGFGNVDINTGGALPSRFSGQMRRALAVVVDDVHYAHPIQFKTEFPQNGNLGTFYSRVKNMNAKVRVQDENDHSAKSGIEVWLLRKTGQRPAGVPLDELTPGDFSANPVKVIGGQSYEVLEKKDANSQGEATFQNLVFFNYYNQYDNDSNPYDRYYAYAEQEESSFSLKEITPVAMVFDFDGYINPLFHTLDFSAEESTWFGKTQSMENYSVDGQTILAGSDYPFHYTTPPTLYTVVNTKKDKPRLITTVRNEAAGIGNTTLNRAEPNVKYSIYKINRAGMQQAKNEYGDAWGGYTTNNNLASLQMFLGNKMVLEKSGTTGDGKIDVRGLSNQWDGPQQIGFYRFLKVWKAGFGTRIFGAKSTGPGEYSISGDMQYIAHGETFQMPDIEIRPLGSLFVKLVNERGEAVVGEAYYHDPASGQNGKTKSGMMLQEYDGDYSYVIPDMNVPTGQIAIVVQPTATNLYVRDTFMVNVPEGQQHSVTLQVKYKLHRIYFNVWGKVGGPARPIAGAKVTLMGMTGNSAVMYNDLRSPYIHEGINLGGLGISPIQQVGEIATGNTGGNNLQVQHAEAPNTEAMGPYAKLTNNGGGVDFAFRNAGTSFTFRITGPNGEISYVTIERDVSSAAGKHWKTETVELKGGRKVTGTVKLGQAPVAGAKVRVLDLEPQIEATTDAEGRYEMNGVPRGVNLRFSASKPGSGYVGMEYDEAHPAGPSVYGNAEYSTANVQIFAIDADRPYSQPVTQINFKLRIYENLDLSKLLGFPLEVTALTETTAVRQFAPASGNTGSAGRNNAANDVVVELSGFVHVSDSLNTIFKLNETNTNDELITAIRFEHKLVVADDIKNDSLIPYSRPQTLPFRTTVNEQTLAVYDFYNAKMRDDAGIGLNKLGAGPQSQGVAEAKVSIELTSFTDNNIGLADGQLFYLAHQNGNQTTTTFPVFTSSGAAVVTEQQGIGLSNANGGGISYKLHELDARAAAHTSRVHRDSMVLDTRLQTNLQYVDNPNLDLPIGGVTINRELGNIDRDIDATTTMGSFSIRWNHIKLSSSQGGVKLNGIIDAAGMNLPFSNAALYPTRFEVPDGSLDVDNIKLLDHIDVQVNAPASFGYEAARNAWVVAIYEAGRTFGNPSAAFSTAQLQGFPADRSIPISSIYLYSDDTRDINLYNTGNYSFRLFDIVNFYIDNVLPATGILKMPGTLNLGIPAFPNYTSAVQYDKVPDGISGLSFQHFDMHPVTVNGVVMGFDPGNNTQSGNYTAINLSAGRLVIKGTVSDENPEVFRNLRSTITKTNQLTELVIDEPEGGRQQMPLGGANTGSRMILSEIAGKMWVANDAWNHLYIDGDMPESMGFTADGKRMRFKVLGALKVDSQQVKLKNISSPFGNINLVYDMANHRLSGGLRVEVGTRAGAAAFDGAINMVIDRNGYYFMSGLNVSLSSPRMQGMAFLLIGDYNARTIEMDALLSTYSIFIQKKLQTIDPMLVSIALSLLSQDAEAGVGFIKDNLGNDYLPVAYTGLFNGGAFNGFYFNAGASIPVPLIPSFEVDLSPIAMMGISVNMGADVRFGANFGATDTYSVGFSVFLDVYFRERVSWGLACMYGRIGVMVPLSFNGVFNSNGSYLVNAEGELILSGELRAGAGVCINAKCDDLTCAHISVGGSMTCGMRGTITNNGANYEIYIRENNLDEPVNYEPPPIPPAGEQ